MACPRKRCKESVFLSNSGAHASRLPDGINARYNTAGNCGITLPKVVTQFLLCKHYMKQKHPLTNYGLDDELSAYENA